MDIKAPIGVMDSGVGGLSVLRCLQQALPHEAFFYIGDTARAPYGTRTRENIIGLACEVVNYLERVGVKELVVACNTITFVGLEAIRGTPPFDVVGMDTGAAAALALSKTKRIGVLATNFTVSTGVHAKTIQNLCPEAAVFAVPGTKLVPLIEANAFGTAALDAAVSEYAHAFQAHDVDTVILSCTHYPFIREMLQDKLGSGVAILDPAQVTAAHAAQVLRQRGLLRGEGDGHAQVCFTGDVALGQTLAARMLDLTRCSFAQIRL